MLSIGTSIGIQRTFGVMNAHQSAAIMISHSTSRPRSEHRRNDSPSALQPGCFGGGGGGTCHFIRRYVSSCRPHCQGKCCNASPHAVADLQAHTAAFTGRQRGASGQSPQEQRCAESQQVGMLPFSGAMLNGVSSSAGKFIWKVDPVFGTRLSCGGMYPEVHTEPQTAPVLTPTLLYYSGIRYRGPPIMALTHEPPGAAHTLTRPRKANHSVKFRAPPPTNVIARWLMTG